MEMCTHCRRLFLRNRGDTDDLVLVEVEDSCGFWLEWLCDGCLTELFSAVLDPASAIEGFTLYGFELPHTG